MQRNRIKEKPNGKVKPSLTARVAPCPIGSHWVREHPLAVPPSTTNPDGITIRRAPKNPASARGLMQITDETRVILGNKKGELKNHHFELTREDLNDPNVNICAGVRWLFHKKRLASGKLKRQASWIEAVAEYKSLSRDHKSKNVKKRAHAADTLDTFKRFYNELQKCKKS